MGTFLMNMSGEIVGVVTDDFKNENTQNATAAAGISDYKGIIERMSNGLSTAYLGIRGQEITEEMEAQGLPAGIYITEVAAGSPAYEAGIQNGDILVRLNRRGSHSEGAAEPGGESGSGIDGNGHRCQKRNRPVQRAGISDHGGSQVTAWLPV